MYLPSDEEPEPAGATDLSSDVWSKPSPINELLERLEVAGEALGLEMPGAGKRSHYVNAVQ